MLSMSKLIIWFQFTVVTVTFHLQAMLFGSKMIVKTVLPINQYQVLEQMEYLIRSSFNFSYHFMLQDFSFL